MTGDSTPGGLHDGHRRAYPHADPRLDRALETARRRLRGEADQSRAELDLEGRRAVHDAVSRHVGLRPAHPGDGEGEGRPRDHLAHLPELLLRRSRHQSEGRADRQRLFMAEQATARPDRIRWLASIPWQYPDNAKAELARAVKAGAVGVMQLANVAGAELTDEKFAPVWSEIDALGLPVLIHPGTPPGMAAMNLGAYGLVPPIGFMIDTTLAFSRMIFSGFLDRYPHVKLIAAHGGATLPYLAGRLDRCHEMIPACASVIKEKPSEYLKRIWYDTVVYDQRALEMCIAVAGSADRVLYGSDYPHNIGDMAGCLARVDALPGAQAKRVRGAAARELFGL